MLRRPAALAVAALLLSAAASGCGSPEENRYAVEPAPVAGQPILEADQVGRILRAVDARLAAGWGQADPRRFGARVESPYLDLATHAMQVSKKRKLKVVAKPVDRSLVVVPVQDGWPRFFVTVGLRDGHDLPVVQVFRSTSGRDPYALWAELDLLPGRRWPATSPDPSQIVALDPHADAKDLGLRLSPEAAVRAYAGVLTKGKSTKVARHFTGDEFGTQVRARVSQEAKALKAVAKVTSSHAMVKDGVLALRLGDGSALVFGRLVQKHVISVKKGSGSVTVTNPDIVALLGKKSIKKILSRQALEVVVLRVPAPGAGKVTVVAAGKGDVKVSGS
jgi:hypothetical protein